MEQNQALNVLVQAVKVAQKRGTYNLDEASAIAAAVGAFTTQPEAVTSSVVDKVIDNEDPPVDGVLHDH